MINAAELLRSKEEYLFNYSQYQFLRKINKKELFEKSLMYPMLKDIESGNVKIIELIQDGETHYFFIRLLEWDTRYFGFSIYRIEFILYNHNDLSILNNGIKKFIENHIGFGDYYMINIPCEDTLLTQSICNTDFKLVETRLNYYLSDIQTFSAPRFSVRKALNNDAENLRAVASKMRNKYDRVHADSAFSEKTADDYLGEFAFQSVNGFADIVLVPNIEGVKPFGFLAGNNPINVCGINVSKLVLAAIDSSVEDGWLFKLLTEMVYCVKEMNADYLTTITQASNKSAVHVWEKCGFKLGYTTHVFSLRKQ